MIKEILTSSSFLDKSTTMYSSVNKAIPNGIISSPVNKWKHNRKLMNSTFTHRTITAFIPIFKRGTNILVEELDGFVGRGELEVFEIIKQTFLDMALETTMGTGPNQTNNNHNKMISGFNYLLKQAATGAVLSTVKLGFLTLTPRYYRTQQFIQAHIEKLIKDKRKANNCKGNSKTMENQSNSDDCYTKKEAIFINRALNFQDQGLFGQDDVINETKTIVSGSFDTVSTQIYSILIMLAMHPNVQEKLYVELIQVMPENNISLEYKHLKHCPYMDMVIKETLRLMPSIPVIGREAANEIQVNGINFPKDIQVMIPIFILHRRKDLWGPNANAFNPDNFLPERMSERRPYAYIPFSKGARNCIGWYYAETVLRIILFGLIRNFKFSTSFQYENLVFSNHISLRYVEEPKLQIYRRNHAIEKIN
ncbi:unnamed protein product [Ceratitis capitata]|uniref:(Mediterranean fruit fly) hypothetical protein n=1 Tax=Ceratitis capitata TaxID=7213 RepID=A0A811UAF8_CERCA|nr:unnamed protein product [Ceratitis capitata]